MGAFAVIIPKGTQYPLSRPLERTFYTTSDRLIRVPVYEGEDSAAERNDLQGTVEYELPKEVDLNTPVTVSFNYDKDRVLTVGIRVHGDEKLTHEAVVQRDRPRPGAEADDESWREELDGTATAAEDFLDRYGAFLEPGVARKTQEDVARARQAHAEGNKAVGQRVMEALRMTVLGSGVATHLYLAERVADGTSPEKSERLTRAARELREAHKRGDRRRVDQISSALAAAVAEAIRERIGQAEAEPRDYMGLLRER